MDTLADFPETTTLSAAQSEDLKKILSKKGDNQSSIRGLFRFARLENQLVELAAFDAAKWGYSKLRDTCVAYGTLGDLEAKLLAESAELHASGLYITPAVLRTGASHRYPHRVWQRASDSTATEADVVESRVLVIDVDVAPLIGGKPAKRKNNTSKSEWQTSIVRGWLVRSWLVELGVSPDSLAFGSSGNGCHVLLALDGAWSSDWKAARERLLNALAKLWDLNQGETTYRIDPAMADGGRFIPLYGTKKAKAAHFDEYPQRWSWIVAPENVTAVGFEGFSALLEKAESAITLEVQAQWDEREKREGKPSSLKVETSSEPTPGAWIDYYQAIDALSITSVAESFGISLEECPNCRAKKGFGVLGNVAKCHHQTEGCGSHKGGVFNAVDLVRISQGGGLDYQSPEKRRAAQDAIAEKFGIAKPRGRRPKEREEVADSELVRRAYGFDPEIEFCSEPEAFDDLNEPQVPEEPEAAISRARTDLGNAYRIIDRRGRDLLRCRDNWWMWGGDRWRALTVDETRRIAIQVLETIPLEAVGLTGLRRRVVLDWAESSQFRNRVDGAETLARSLATQIEKEQFDGDGWLLGCPNGVVDLRTGQFREHRREDYITRHTICEFHPDAKAPNFMKVLEWAQPDAEVRGYLLRLWGSSISGIVREHVFPIMWGQGGNGKGTILHAIRKMLGEYAISLPMDALMARKNDSHPTTLADLPGSRFVLASESNEGSIWDEALVKRLTGGDGSTFRKMRQDYSDHIEQTWHLTVMSNQMIRLLTVDDAIRRRFQFVKWGQKVSKPDGELPEKLEREAAGILNVLIQGCLDWQRRGLDPPARVLASTKAYLDEQDGVAQFIAECGMTGEGYWVPYKLLISEYTSWARGRNEVPLGARRFSAELSKLGFEAEVRGKDNVAGRLGLTLISQMRVEHGDVDLDELDSDMDDSSLDDDEEVSAAVGLI